MIVVVHEHIRVDLEAESLGEFAQQFEEAHQVSVIAVDGLLFIAASGDVITSARSFDSQWSSHGVSLPSSILNVNYLDLTPWFFLHPPRSSRPAFTSTSRSRWQ